jgi:hypothetical protein
MFIGQNKRRSTVVWLVIVWQILALLFALLGSNGVRRAFFLLSYGSPEAFNIFYHVWTILTALIIGIYLYKLLSFKKTVILWTDIAMGNAILRRLAGIQIGAMTHNVITEGANLFAMVVTLIIWLAFRKHLKKLMNNSPSIEISPRVHYNKEMNSQRWTWWEILLWAYSTIYLVIFMILLVIGASSPPASNIDRNPMIAIVLVIFTLPAVIFLILEGIRHLKDNDLG